jgi:hypothetical protein
MTSVKIPNLPALRPSLNFDFAKIKTPDPRVTFSRASTATYFDQFGVLQTAAAGVARFDHNPVTGESLGLLIEEQRTNLLLRSQEFDYASWAKTNVTVTADAVIAPDGTLSADAIAATTVNGAHQIYQGYTPFNNGTTYTFSFFVKSNGVTSVYVLTGDTVSLPLVCTFDLSAATASTGGTITNVGNGWYRCTITAACTATIGTGIYIRLTSGSFVGDGSSGVYLWGAQLEAGAFATSYIPTTTTALTRNADVATITGTNFSGFWQASKGGVLVRARPGTVSGTRPWVQFDDNTADNIIALRGNTTNPELYIKAITDQAAIDAGTIAANTSYRLAGTWATNDCAASLNGAATVLDTSATIPAVTQMRIGSDGTNYLNGHIEAIEYYDQRLLDASMQVVSSPAGYRSIIGPVMRDTIIR